MTLKFFRSFPQVCLKASLLLLGSGFAISALEGRTASMVAARAQAAMAEGVAPTWFSVALPEDIRSNAAKKGEKLAAKLGLSDVEQSKRVAELVADHYGKVWAWHQQVDTKLDAAWGEWDEARSNLDGKEKDELKALAIMTEQIDPIYAEFAPQIQAFLKAMHDEVGEEKTTALLDVITRSPGAPRTYNAYLAMVPQMTEDEKAVIWGRLAQAREDSLAAWSDKRIVKIFKKYKVRNEFSIDYFGYGYQKSYRAWIEASKKAKS